MAQSQRGFLVVLGLIVVGGAAFIGTKMMNRGGGVSIPANPIVTTADTSGFRGYVTGAASAPVEITEYADFECPHCSNFDAVSFPDVKARLIDAGKVRFRFRDWPIEGHMNSRLAAHAAACANDQQHFWDTKKALFQRQREWAERSDGYTIIRDIMKESGVAVDPWETCMKSAKYAGRIQASLLEGNQLGVAGTPTFLIGGRLYEAGFSVDQMVKLVDSLVGVAAKGAGTTKPISGE